jgi:hypothetical protein
MTARFKALAFRVAVFIATLIAALGYRCPAPG